jgi:hypothetical protein
MHPPLTNVSMETPKNNRCIVRLRTSTWSDSKGLYIKRSLTYLRRRCASDPFLEEDTVNMGAEEILSKIKNLDECEDGVYAVVISGAHRDWETGCLDDYDYALVPEDKKEGEG